MARGGTQQDPRKLLVRWLERQRKPMPGYAYAGPTDFVLRHGEWFEPRPLPDGYQAGLPGFCFGVAIATAVLHGIDYVEGYAVDPGAARRPFHHSWNADADGLVDATWTGTHAVVDIVGSGSGSVLVRGLAGLAYFGVRFSVERADDCTWNGDASVLDDSERGWPLLREPWTGEDPAAVWPYSPRLEALRLGRDGDRDGAREKWDAECAS